MWEADWGRRDPRWAGIRSDDVVIDGVEVNLLRAGRPDVGDQLPVLLVHGLGGAATNWLDVLGGLAESGEVVAVDLPGFGHTEPPTTRAARIGPQVRFLQRLLDRLGWERVELHGNSMGGLISSLLTAQAPERVARLVLASPALTAPLLGGDPLERAILKRFVPFVASRRLGHRVLLRQYERLSPPEMFAQTEQLVMGSGGRMREAMRAVGIEHATAARQLPWRAESFAHATSTMLATIMRGARDVDAAVEQIEAPMLVLWGEQDRLVRRAVIDALAKRRPDVTRIDLPEVGHVPMIEAPDHYLEVVRRWRVSVGASPVDA